MTLCLYKRGEYIAADRRVIGGFEGINQEKKLFVFKDLKKGISMTLAMSWIIILPEVVLESIKNVADKFEFTNESYETDMSLFIYAFRKEVRAVTESEPFSIILISHQLMWNVEKGFREDQLRGTELAFTLTQTYAEKLDSRWTIGSSSLYAEGIFLGNPEIEVAKIFELCSTKDYGVSKEYDIIKL